MIYSFLLGLFKQLCNIGFNYSAASTTNDEKISMKVNRLREKFKYTGQSRDRIIRTPLLFLIETEDFKSS